MRPLTPLVMALVAAGGFSGCAADPQATYCDRVAEHQTELTEVAASRDDEALFDALPPYRDLAEHAPRDIAGEWEQVVGALEGLQRAVDGGDEQKVRAAAEELGSRQTVEAMAALEQQALDVCGTPLAR